jgi:hypothetical protein
MVELGRFDDYAPRQSHSNWVTTIDGCKVAVHGDENFGAHMRLIGVDPSPACSDQLMHELGEWQTRPEVSIHNIMAFGTTAYVAHYQDGVRLVDLGDPANPTQIAYYNTWRNDELTGYDFFEGTVGIDVDLTRRLIFVADIPRGLIVLHLD